MVRSVFLLQNLTGVFEGLTSYSNGGWKKVENNGAFSRLKKIDRRFSDYRIIIFGFLKFFLYLIKFQWTQIDIKSILEEIEVKSSPAVRRQKDREF